MTHQQREPKQPLLILKQSLSEMPLEKKESDFKQVPTELEINLNFYSFF